MRATHRAEFTTGVQVMDGLTDDYYCSHCREYKGIQLVHDFENDPGKVWEIVECGFCGRDFESKDVTQHYLPTDPEPEEKI